MAETAISFNVFYMYAYVSVSYDDCFVKIWATCENFLGKWFTAPPWQKITRTPIKKGKNRCLPIVLSVRLSSYIRKIKNFTTNTINFKNTNLDRTHRLPVKMHKVLKYYLTEMSLISNLDSYNIVLNTFLFLVENISCEQCRVAG